MRFVSLHQHTEGSALDGLVSVKDLVQRAKDYGEEAVAITDHGNLTMAFKFYEECKKQGIKPIIGEEFYISKRRMTDKELEDRERYHLTVLAKNMTGLRNLFKLTTLSHTEGFYYKNRIDDECLFEHKEGLIVLSGCHSSKISQYLVGDPESGVESEPIKAVELARKYKQEFGEDFYLEIQTHGLKGSPRMWVEQQKLNAAVIALGKKLDIPVVLTADSHYLDLEDTNAHEVLLCIGTAARIDEENRMTLKEFDLSFPNPDNVEKWLMDEYGNTEYADRTLEVADKVDIQWEYGSYLIPKFPTPNGESEEQYIKKLIWAGLKKKIPNYTDEYIEEIKLELKVLGDKGYLGYFLIVQDYVNWAKSQGIEVGPSRGSACGCLIAYLLNITEIDPLQHGMLFERFMNPERPSAPDIDVDFQDDRREEVVQYVTQKYGKDCVCNILVLNYMKSKSVFKDVARTYNLSFQRSNEISALIPQDIAAHQNPLAVSLSTIPELIKLQEDPEIKEIFDYCLKLEGKPRNHGVHACGIIIAPSDLTDYIPLETDKDGKIVSGFPPEDLEKLGLLKMDFLGLSTLTVIHNAIAHIPDLNGFYDIPTDDEATFDTFCNGKSYRTFQFKTPLARETCIKMHPRDIQGLSDVTAIARPGPMQSIPVYERRRKGEEEVSYISPIAKKYFSNTYGLNIYQEQGMQYLQEGAGFTKAEADFWRKGVAKAKYKSLLDDLYPKYLEGCKRIQGMKEEVAAKWWNDQVEGGAYTFNLAHSYAYAWLGYATCYLLTHYPVQYLAAEMNNVQKDKDKLTECFEVCKELKISILPPDALQSDVDFVPTERGIVYGLSAIHGMGNTASKVIEFMRTEQPKTLEELLLKAPKTMLNKTRLRGMVFSGALDSIESNRWGMITAFEDILKWRDSKHTKPLELPVNPNADFSIKKLNKDTLEMLRLEKEITGRFMTKNPLEYYGVHGKQKLDEQTSTSKDNYGKQIWVDVYGIVEKVEHRITRNHNMEYDSVEFNIGEETITLLGLKEKIGKFHEGDIYRVTCLADEMFGNRHKVLAGQCVTPRV